MRSPFIVPVLAVAVAALGAPGTSAAIESFSGSSFNINPPATSGPTCPAPLLDLSFGPDNTGGTSNFGSFRYTQAHCALGGPGAYGGGVFEYLFDAGDTLEGTYTGLLAPTGTAGLLSNHIEYTVTSGTGRFLGGSGSIVGDGTLDFRSGVARADLALNGALNLPAVPEPSTWSLFLVGAGAMGVGLRGKVRRKPASASASVPA